MEIDVIKIGGSLFSDPSLKTNLVSFVNNLQSEIKVVVSGGGVNVRNYEKNNSAPNCEKEHWDCIKIMTDNVQAIGRFFIPTPKTTDGLPTSPGLFLFDAYSFCMNDLDSALKPILPCNRSVRSDTIALRYAIKIRATRLWLLKSCPIQPGISWREASYRGLVDDYFGELEKTKPPQLKIEWLDFSSLGQSNCRH